MINGEKYENDIKKVNYLFGLNKTNYEICSCKDLRCPNCLFDSVQENGNCGSKKIEWLYQEYKEPINLTDFDKELLKKCWIAGYRWIVRDENKELYFYNEKPTKAKHQWEFAKDEYLFVDSLAIPNFLDDFSFVKWSDEEPCNIEKLLEDK